jgi:hypothetical protein
LHNLRSSKAGEKNVTFYEAKNKTPIVSSVIHKIKVEMNAGNE